MSFIYNDNNDIIIISLASKNATRCNNCIGLHFSYILRNEVSGDKMENN